MKREKGSSKRTSSPSKQKTYKNPTQDAQRKMLGMMLSGLAGLLVILFVTISFGQKEIQVVRLKNAVASGDVIGEDDIESFTVLERAYNEMGKQSYVDADGNKQSGNVYIKWDEREEKALNRTVSNYVKDGTLLTIRDLTDKMVSRNPWLNDIKPDQEIYTMKFNPDDVNYRLLMPGTQIRARLVVSISPENLAQIRQELASKTGKTDVGVVGESTLMGYATQQTSQEPVLDENGNIVSYGSATLTDKVAVAEMVIPKITIADMTNSSGESIFDVYSSLVKMPIADRVNYIKTTLEDSDTATSFQNRVKPEYLTFIVDEAGANMLAEFENMEGATLKYTILPGYGEDISEEAKEMLSQFGEINNMISNGTSTDGGEA